MIVFGNGMAKRTLIGLMTGWSAMVGAVEWEDLEINSINRLPARTYSMPLASVESALTDALEPDTPYVKSLNLYSSVEAG